MSNELQDLPELLLGTPNTCLVLIRSQIFSRSCSWERVKLVPRSKQTPRLGPHEASVLLLLLLREHGVRIDESDLLLEYVPRASPGLTPGGFPGHVPAVWVPAGLHLQVLENLPDLTNIVLHFSVLSLSGPKFPERLKVSSLAGCILRSTFFTMS